MKMTPAQIKDGLRNFHGTEQYHRITTFGGLQATDGVAWLVENAECYWLMEDIGIYQMDRKIRGNPELQDFQVWKLTVKDSVGTLTCEDGNDNVVLTHHVSWTDFPLPVIVIWVENKVLLLPTEH